MGSIGTALALWFGGRGVLLQTIGFGTLSAFISYVTQFFGPINELARIIAEFQNAQASAERVMAMINTEPDIVDRTEVIRSTADLNPSMKTGKILRGYHLQNVSFSYKEGEEVLENFNLEVKEASLLPW